MNGISHARTEILPHSTTISLETIGLTKQFGNFTALDDVSIKLRAGQFHALLGENGAGKSTLVKCIMGYYQPSEGSVLVANKETDIASPQQAHLLGLGMVYQHFTLVPQMTVLENLILARPDMPKLINWSKMEEELQAFLSGMPFYVDISKKAQDLAAGEKQKVEILKQLYLGSRFLILDEPTSVLTPDEADDVLGLIKGMTKDDGLTVLMITHKFREVINYADEVTVLRQGKYVGGGPVRDLTPDMMAAMMVGSKVITQPVARNNQDVGQAILAVSDLVAENEIGREVLAGVNFELRKGEILGIAGVSGNGQRELVEILSGQRLKTSGDVNVNGYPFHATRGEMRQHKVFCLPEEPLINACVPNMSVAENLSFRDFDQPPFALKGVWTNRRALAKKAKKLVCQYNIKTTSIDAPIKGLSGGNVQRTVLARELSGDVDLLVVANPVFGLDFAAVADIHAQLIDARNNGVAVLLVSEDLDEILKLSDRIMVMSQGSITYETVIENADLRTIGRYMAGH